MGLYFHYDSAILFKIVYTLSTNLLSLAYWSIHMRTIRTNIILLLTLLFITACASSPAPHNKPENSAQSQKDNAKRAQDELSSEISR